MKGKFSFGGSKVSLEFKNMCFIIMCISKNSSEDLRSKIMTLITLSVRNSMQRKEISMLVLPNMINRGTIR